MSKVIGVMLAAKVYEGWATPALAENEEAARRLARAALTLAAIFVEVAASCDPDTAKPNHEGLPQDEPIPDAELADATR